MEMVVMAIDGIWVTDRIGCTFEVCHFVARASTSTLS